MKKTVLKIFNGYKKLVSVRKPRSMNENFLKFREIVKEKIFLIMKLYLYLSQMVFRNKRWMRLKVKVKI